MADNDTYLPQFETSREGEAKAELQRLLKWFPRFSARVNELRSQGYDWQFVAAYATRVLRCPSMMVAMLAVCAGSVIL